MRGASNKFCYVGGVWVKNGQSLIEALQDWCKEHLVNNIRKGQDKITNETIARLTNQICAHQVEFSSIYLSFSSVTMIE